MYIVSSYISATRETLYDILSRYPTSHKRSIEFTTGENANKFSLTIVNDENLNNLVWLAYELRKLAKEDTILLLAYLSHNAYGYIIKSDSIVELDFNSLMSEYINIV